MLVRFEVAVEGAADVEKEVIVRRPVGYLMGTGVGALLKESNRHLVE